MKKLSALLFLFLFIGSSAQPGPARVTESTQTFPTYGFSDPSPVPLLSPVYPYFRFDGFATTSTEKKWKTVTIENDYLKLTILPEIGGKIWGAVEKKTGQPFLYYNHAVKFRDVAMRGPWTSGGLEANYGIIGHTPNCATPVDYLLRVNADSSVSCIIGALDLLSRSNWRLEINLRRDKAYFTTSSFWYNTTPLSQPYYHWMNAGLKADGDLQFIYPGNKYLGHEGEYSDWPVNKENGKAISFYRENNFGGYKSYHVFGKYTDFFGAYWHKDQFGMVRYGSHDDKAGKKIWIWGLSRQGMIWEKLLSDTDGQYVEVQSGRLFNQNAPGSSLTPFKHRSFGAYQTDKWKEYWYPVLGTDGFVAASPAGAINLTASGKKAIIRFSPVADTTAILRVTASGQTLYEKSISVSALQLFSDSFSLAKNGVTNSFDSLVLRFGDQLIRYEASPTAGDLNRPVDAPKNFDWTSAYGYYLKGVEAIDQKFFPAAETALDSALLKDSNFLPALVSLAELRYRNMQYAGGLSLARRALSIHSDDGSANFIYGLLNESLGHADDAKDGFDIASLDPAYRSAACVRLARIWLHEENPGRASGYAAKALESDPQNMEALQVQALLARLQHDTSGYNQSLNAISAFDPLSTFLSFEKAGGGKTAPGSWDSTGFRKSVRNEMPQESFLELATWYASLGQTSPALRVLRQSPPVAEVQLWINWLENTQPDAGKLDPVRAFPFRAETAAMLEEMIKNNKHWFLCYQLALIYYSRNRVEEARALLKDCGNSPGYAPFYAFRAALTVAADSASVETDLKKAVALDEQWRYKKLLAEFYLDHDNPVAAEKIAGPFYKNHSADYIMGMLYAQTLLLNKKYVEADKLLAGLTVIPFEGATSGRVLYRETKLMLAVQALRKGKYKPALARTADARLWPERLGSGQPYPEEEDLRLEDWVAYRCYVGLHDSALARQALERIVSFSPRIDNTVPNFIPANDQITGWARKRLGLPEAAYAPERAINLRRRPGANERVLAALPKE